MPDESTSNPAPVDTSIPQAPETPISTPLESVIAPAPEETPVAPVPVPEQIPEEQTVGINQLLGASSEASATRIEASPQSPISENINSQMGGNEPFELAPAVETPVTTPAPAQNETPAPEGIVTETTPTEPVTEATPAPTTVETSTPAQTQTEAPTVAESADSRLGRRVETPAPTQIPEPVVQAPTPAPVIATVVAPVIATTITQTFTKSIRELFTKAQLTIQNRKRKKLDRILSLFAKQTMITNNEVEKLLHVSDATTTRYLSTLEKEGKIKQNKKTGKGVSYSKI